MPLEEEDNFRRLFSGKRVLCDHFTRLLDHEVERIRREGLHPLTAELIESRLRDAHASGVIDKETMATLLRKNLLAGGHGDGRTSRVCFVIGRTTLGSSGVGCDDQLSIWGGEAIYRSSVEVKELVRGIGQPAIVATQIDVSADDVVAFPALSRLFVGAVLGTEPGYGELHLKQGGVPPGDIVGVYRPADPDYERYAGLPPD